MISLLICRLYHPSIHKHHLNGGSGKERPIELWWVHTQMILINGRTTSFYNTVRIFRRPVIKWLAGWLAEEEEDFDDDEDGPIWYQNRTYELCDRPTRMWDNQEHLFVCTYSYIYHKHRRKKKIISQSTTTKYDRWRRTRFPRIGCRRFSARLLSQSQLLLVVCGDWLPFDEAPFLLPALPLLSFRPSIPIPKP